MKRAFVIENLESFLSKLRPADLNHDADGLVRRFKAPVGWRCSDECFHSLQEAKQYFLSECVCGEGLHLHVHSGMTVEEIDSLAKGLHERASEAGSPLRFEAVRSAIFRALDNAAPSRGRRFVQEGVAPGVMDLTAPRRLSR